MQINTLFRKLLKSCKGKVSRLAEDFEVDRATLWRLQFPEKTAAHNGLLRMLEKARIKMQIADEDFWKWLRKK